MSRESSFRTIVARFPATCRRCKDPIPVGTSMRFGGRGNTWHLAADCKVAETDETGENFDPFAKTRSRGYYGRDAGRCEDAPCCGCC